MKILVVADLHYNLKQFDWLLEKAPDFELVVIAGDLLDIAGHAELDAQIVVITKYLEKLRTLVPVLVCSGNHDGDVKTDNDEYVAEWLQEARNENLFVDGDTFSFDGGAITICPWWDGPVTQKELAPLLREAKKENPPLWIWIHHAPPKDSPLSWAGKKEYGDELLLSLIEELQPALVFTGHIHNAPFSSAGAWCDQVGDTWVFNAGREMGALPTRIEIDTDLMEATWISSMGVETRKLAPSGPSNA